MALYQGTGQKTSDVVRQNQSNVRGGGTSLRKSTIELRDNSPTSVLADDPFHFASISYPRDVTQDMANGHYMLFYVNVQNQTKFAANYKTPAGLTVEEKVAGQNYGAEQMAAGQAPARSFTKEQALLEGKEVNPETTKAIGCSIKA